MEKSNPSLLVLADSILEGLKLVSVLEIAPTCTYRMEMQVENTELCTSVSWWSHQLAKGVLWRMPFLSIPEIITIRGLALLAQRWFIAQHFTPFVVRDADGGIFNPSVALLESKVELPKLLESCIQAMWRQLMSRRRN